MNSLSTSSERLHALLSDLARSSRAAEGLMRSGTAFGGVDSITKLEAVLAIEGEFGIELTEHEMAQVHTFPELSLLVDRKRAEVPAGADASGEHAQLPTATEPLPSVPVAAWGRPAAATIAAAMGAWFRVDATGLEHAAKAGGCLLCANHASHLDSAALLAVAGAWRERLVFAAAKDYFFSHAHMTRCFANALPMIPWERGGDLSAMRENMRQLAACRAAGRIVVFFPEGGRSLNGELQPFKEGLAFFASRLGLPVLPCWIGGTHRALPKGACWPRPGRLTVRFGELLRIAADETAFADRVRANLLTLRDASA